MTRTSMNRTLSFAYTVLAMVLFVALAARLIEFVPGIAGTRTEKVAIAIYEYMKDMTLIFITVIAAYLANIFQKRSNFVSSLEAEWRNIVKTKSALFMYCKKQHPTHDDYLIAFCRISEAIDNMRIVYENVGETKKLIGLYPYAPLHDMRRALQWIDPRKRSIVSPQERDLVKDAILQSFYALRENFLEELDIEQPRHPLLISAGRRMKSPGATRRALRAQKRQARVQTGKPLTRADIDGFLGELYALEKAAEKAANEGTSSVVQR